MIKNKTEIREFINKYKEPSDDVIIYQSLYKKCFFNKDAVKQDVYLIKSFFANNFAILKDSIYLDCLTINRIGDKVFNIENNDDIELFEDLVALGQICGIIFLSDDSKLEFSSIFPKNDIYSEKNNEDILNKFIADFNYQLVNVKADVNSLSLVKYGFLDELSDEEISILLFDWLDDQIKFSYTFSDVEELEKVLKKDLIGSLNYILYLKLKKIDCIKIYEQVRDNTFLSEASKLSSQLLNNEKYKHNMDSYRTAFIYTLLNKKAIERINVDKNLYTIIDSINLKKDF